MKTIGRLAREFGLSRSTLLYYDSIGLLSPSHVGENGYRLYDGPDEHRLRQICTYRQAGIKLKEIKDLLDAPESGVTQALERRLNELSDEIDRLRDQQVFIVQILKSSHLPEGIDTMSVVTWIRFLKECGFTEDEMLRWHRAFETHAPDRHEAFLRFLRIPEQEIPQIREWARNDPNSMEERSVPSSV
jgi:DNA-binding transcriptional MerR regulator